MMNDFDLWILIILNVQGCTTQDFKFQVWDWNELGVGLTSTAIHFNPTFQTCGCGEKGFHKI
jgi:hypothetical protein